jgi:ABC-2 type transport system ATP-binding protein
LESHLVRAQTSYLPGDLRLYGGKTGWETVELIAGLRGRRPNRRYVQSLADTLGLDLARHAGTLSKGNRQKLGLVLALFDRPAVFLLDEPTSGLDPISQRLVWDLLRQEAARGATIFFSSHVMSEVESVCERVAILRRGRLVAVEPIAALKERALRRLEVTFARPVPPDAFAIDGVRELERSGHTVWLEVPGHLDEVVKAIARHSVVDLRTEQASLDDILLTFYRESRP